MTLRIHERQTLDDIGRNLSEALDGMRVKQVQAYAGHVSHPTAEKYMRGELSVLLAPFFKLVKSLGQEAAARVLEPLIGSRNQINLAARLDELDRNLGALRHDLSRSSTAVVAGVPHAVLDPAGRVGEGPGGSAGAAGGYPGSGLAAEEDCVLVSVRRDPGDLAREDLSALRRHLNIGNVISLDRARALAQADNRGTTGVCYRNPGEDWRAITAPENRLWTPSVEARPITAFAGNVVALRRDLDEAAAESGPVFVTHAGAVLRGGEIIPFHSAVVRIGAKSPCGASVVVTDFVRKQSC